jgi:hypothetical protein
MDKTIKSIATNYGLYLGGILAGFIVLAYAVKLELLATFWYGIIMFLAVIACGVISVAKSKSALDGFISFKQGFTSYFITILIGILISSIIYYIIFNIIDLEAAETLKQQAIEKTINFMEGFGTPSETIAETVDKMENENQFSIGNIVQSLAMQLVLYSVIGLIVAAIMKRKDVEA